jgi:hypothetical protein
MQGEESVKERITLDEDKVVPFLEMDYDIEQVGLRVLSSAQRRVYGTVCPTCRVWWCMCHGVVVPFLEMDYGLEQVGLRVFAASNAGFRVLHTQPACTCM